MFPGPTYSVRSPEWWSRPTPAKLSAAAPTAASLSPERRHDQPAGASGERADQQPGAQHDGRPAERQRAAVVGVAAEEPHQRADRPWPRRWSTVRVATSAGAVVPGRCAVNEFHRSLVEPPSASVCTSATGGADRISAGARPRHSATAAPSRPIATTQPASGRWASPPNSHRAAISTATAPPMRRTVDGGGDVGESASKASAAT